MEEQLSHLDLYKDQILWNRKLSIEAEIVTPDDPVVYDTLLTWLSSWDAFLLLSDGLCP